MYVVIKPTVSRDSHETAAESHAIRETGDVAIVHIRT